MRLQLLPVYSQLADETAVLAALRGRSLPDGMRLRQHQVETLAAVEDPDVDTVIAVAMTGDGKSLAAYLRPLIGSSGGGPNEDRMESLLAMYPTNALIDDQCRQIAGYQERLKRHSLCRRSVARNSLNWLLVEDARPSYSTNCNHNRKSSLSRTLISSMRL